MAEVQTKNTEKKLVFIPTRKEWQNFKSNYGLDFLDFKSGLGRAFDKYLKSEKKDSDKITLWKKMEAYIKKLEEKNATRTVYMQLKTLIKMGFPTSLESTKYNSSFEDRLANDFNAEFSGFVRLVWNSYSRQAIDLEDIKWGANQIYEMYTSEHLVNFDPEKSPEIVGTFAYQLLETGKFINNKKGGYKIELQGEKDNYDANYSVFDNGYDIPRYAEKMWDDFYIVQNDCDQRDASERIYVHPKNNDSKIAIMKFVIAQYPENKNIIQAKVAGPGCYRNDGIVIYLKNKNAADELANKLCKLDSKYFAESLPYIVKKVKNGYGVGRATEPPKMKLRKGFVAEQSFGKMYSELLWIALKNADAEKNKEPKEKKYLDLKFLDQIKYQFKLLKIDIQNPSVFPDREEQEKWAKKNALYFQKKENIADFKEAIKKMKESFSSILKNRGHKSKVVGQKIIQELVEGDNQMRELAKKYHELHHNMKYQGKNVYFYPELMKSCPELEQARTAYLKYKNKNIDKKSSMEPSVSYASGTEYGTEAEYDSNDDDSFASRTEYYDSDDDSYPSGTEHYGGNEDSYPSGTEHHDSDEDSYPSETEHYDSDEDSKKIRSYKKGAGIRSINLTKKKFIRNHRELGRGTHYNFSPYRKKTATSNTIRGLKLIQKARNQIRTNDGFNVDDEFWC